MKRPLQLNGLNGNFVIHRDEFYKRKRFCRSDPINHIDGHFQPALSIAISQTLIDDIEILPSFASRSIRCATA
ncbi:MAG: hypothetical protein A4E57_04377 [Syntrophorhabdaceae bacterium PtaU1.Bin034]|nr:MAG: hypothetical protein A4E57_04377 [Syntrophorhabdaceae bacterium PtaU1.Bin034]